MNDIFYKKRIFSVRASNGNSVNVEVPDIDSDSLITTIPAGYMLEFLVLHETTGADVTIDIGTTAGDDDLISSLTVSGSGFSTQSLGSVFSLTSTQQIYISSSAWGTSSLDIFALLRKI